MAAPQTEQQLMQADSKFRYYASLMDKALKSFEYTHEWADLISALAKINKVISGHWKYNVIPKKVTVGKRLAQCLHPALPAGVHIKALELYESIFSSIGGSSLVKDFPIYSSGLLPLLSHASMTVKPLLLKLYESHILPVSSELKAAASGIILGVLPGLEEGTEFYEWTNTILERFCENFGAAHFYTSLWLCLNSNPSVRLSGTCYLLAHINKSRSMEDQLYLLGTDLSLLVSSLKVCLEDSAVLVQRNTLDILSVAFPFHNSPLTRSDQSAVIESAVLVLLRRDMSLNRRLYAWLLGVTTAGARVVPKPKSNPETNRQRHDSGSSSASEPELEYFNMHSKKLLVQSLRSHLDSITEYTTDLIKPMRVVISLLDRAEIGSVVLDDILVNIFRLLRRFTSAHEDRPLACSTQMSTYKLGQSLDIQIIPKSSPATSHLPSKLRSELLKTCNLLFGTLEPNFLWEYLADTYERVLWPSEVRHGNDLSMSEFCDIVNMLLSIVSLESYMDTQTMHLPRLLSNILTMLKENISNVSLSDVTQVLLLSRKLVSVITPAAPSPDIESGLGEGLSVSDCLPYVQDIIHSKILSNTPLSDTQVDDEGESSSAIRRRALLASCLLLIEMSSFPVYLTSQSEDDPDIRSLTDTESTPHGSDIPLWMQSLIDTASGAKTTDTQCQFLCTAAILDLIKLSDLSAETEHRTRPLGRSMSNNSSQDIEMVAVSIRAPIEFSLLEKVKQSLVNIFSHIWSHMQIETYHLVQESSFLLSTLLSVCDVGDGHHSESVRANHNDNMQTIIIKDLTHQDNGRRYEAYKKFSVFWHQSREFSHSSNQTHHILMVVLSSLMFESEQIQEVIREWILHCVQCGDINRILEPFLILLLESDTSRISVQQTFKKERVPHPETSQAQEAEFERSMKAAQSLIRGISSDGYIHRSPAHKMNMKTGTPSGGVSQSVVTKDGLVTHASSSHVNEPLDCDRVNNYNSAGIALNPFGSASVLDGLIFDGFTPHEALKNRWAAVREARKDDYHTILSKAKRLDMATCEREGIVFGASDEIQSQPPVPTNPNQPQHEDTQHSNNMQGPAFSDNTTESNATDGIDIPESDTAAISRSPAPTAIPLPDMDMPYGAREEPPPLDDPEALEIVDSIINDLITLVLSDDSSTHSRDSHSETTHDEMTTHTDSSMTVTSARLPVIADAESDRRESSVSSVASTGYVSSSDSLTNDIQVEDQGAADEQTTPADIKLGAHGFVLLYDQCYDTDRVQFALSAIQSVISVSRIRVLSSLTTSTCSDPLLLDLLVRHKKSLGGDNYYTQLSQEETILYRNTRLLEIIVTVCLYYWRSYHTSNYAGDDCVTRNSQIQLRALDLLTTLTSDLTLILPDCPKGFPQYMVDVLTRCKVDRTCLFHLQCLLEDRHDKLISIGASHDAATDLPLFNKCLKLTESLVCLEAKLQLVYESQTSAITGGVPLFKKLLFSHTTLCSTLSRHLSDTSLAIVHHQWLSVITNSLPHVVSQPDAHEVVRTVIVRVCEVFDNITVNMTAGTFRNQYPPDYIQQLLEDFTVICHFCFTDVTSSLIGQAGTDEIKPASISTGQILSNLVSVFNPLSNGTGGASQTPSELGIADHTAIDGRIQCRDCLLSMLPKILASVSNLWRVHQQSDNHKIVQLVIEFFSPILHNYTEQLLGSVAVVWSDSQDVCTSETTQTTLVELLLSIRALPMDVIVDKLGSVMRKPPSTDHVQHNARVILQLSCLKFLKGYILKTATIPKSSLSSVCSLLKQCLQLGLPAPGILLLLETVTEFVYKLGNIDDRKIVKDLQEIVSKVLEACCQIISTQLEASSWTIRKNYTVKVRAPTSESNNDIYSNLASETATTQPGISVDDSLSYEEHESEYTAHALGLLAEVTAGLLDVVYPSEDKDKVAPLLINILSRVFPYLRNHSLLNMTHYQSSCKLLASISSYQYTRRTWRREVYDILLSPELFKMDTQSLQYWKILADNLVTHEKTMFKDLLVKFAITGTPTIQLFSSKDSELQQRAQNLKKLSFLIYCGDVDHYKHCMPEIQERLAENLRMTQAPAVLSQVFLCFRVLLLRMSSSSLTLLWPTIVTELVHVMTQIEQDLEFSEEEELQMSRVTELDSFSGLNENGVHPSTPAWFLLYLSACKLLDLLMFLPADIIPDFQHYVWMFTGSDDSTSVDQSKESSAINGDVTEGFQGFQSHIPKIAHLMHTKYGVYQAPSSHNPALLLQEQTISSLRDLQPFFSKLLHYAPLSAPTHIVMREAETVLDNDIIEPVN